MRLHRFYINQTIGSLKDIIISSKEITKQITQVFRMKTGDSIIIFDSSGFDYECNIQEISKKTDSITVNVINKIPSRFMPISQVCLYMAIIKKDNFEWVVEKATELGITDIYPVLAERSEKKLLNIDRLKKIAIESSEQSGRGNIPIIHEIKTIKESVDIISAKQNTATVNITFHTEGQKIELNAIKNKNLLNVLIGPEGGWSANEIEMFHKANISIKTLGNQVFRAETAVIVALSFILLYNK